MYTLGGRVLGVNPITYAVMSYITGINIIIINNNYITNYRLNRHTHSNIIYIIKPLPNTKSTIIIRFNSYKIHIHDAQYCYWNTTNLSFNRASIEWLVISIHTPRQISAPADE